ncbi:hypothetical protein SLEP1_g28555 [Rubroshorea leprosula]|uniref:Cytochrome P450 n=1 Tax=Rubroshorea leprosula TaxID=152421 RepID=A0AAV5K3D8_9ROSI|nr:hypothetical protein SLEP1_g28555 [Rubroshorea leprosula]
MSLVFFLLALPLFFFLLCKQRSNGRNTNYLLPPGPSGFPLIGNLQQLNKSAPHVYLWQLSQKYGPLMTLKLGCRNTLVVSSAKMAKEVLKTHDLDFCSRPLFFSHQKLSYNRLGLGTSPYNTYWMEIRKICTIHLFNSNRAELYRPSREDEVSVMIDKILKSSTPSKPINLSQAMICLASAFICRIAFGKRYEDEGTEISRFQGLYAEIQAMLVSFFVSDYFPSMGWIDRFTGRTSRLEKVFKEMDAFCQQLIDDHLDPKRQQAKQEDIVDVLLKIMKDSQYTFDNIKAILVDVFVAGTDTSSATVIWVMTFLIKHPTVMKKAQDEVRNLAGKKGFVNEDDIQDLPYLKAVVKETFRLQGTAPLLAPRETIRDCNIGEYKIPAKTLVYVNAWAIGRDTEAWGQNVEEFNPERFIGSSIDYKGQDFGLIPFGSGRRICPGMNMGATTVELVLANLLYKFDWEIPFGMKQEDLDFDTAPGITMHKRNALYLMAKECKY